MNNYDSMGKEFDRYYSQCCSLQEDFSKMMNKINFGLKFVSISLVASFLLICIFLCLTVISLQFSLLDDYILKGLWIIFPTCITCYLVIVQIVVQNPIKDKIYKAMNINDDIVQNELKMFDCYKNLIILSDGSVDAWRKHQLNFYQSRPWNSDN